MRGAVLSAPLRTPPPRPAAPRRTALTTRHHHPLRLNAAAALPEATLLKHLTRVGHVAADLDRGRLGVTTLKAWAAEARKAHSGNLLPLGAVQLRVSTNVVRGGMHRFGMKRCDRVTYHTSLRSELDCLHPIPGELCGEP